MNIFSPYLRRWRLLPDGEPRITPRGALLPVRAGTSAAMLKIALCAEEQAGNALMVWWRGCGAARILAWENAALLLERAQGKRSLQAWPLLTGMTRPAALVRLCARAAPSPPAPYPKLTPLRERFQALKRGAETRGGILRLCAATADELLAAPREIVALHGRSAPRQCAQFCGARLAGH